MKRKNYSSATIRGKLRVCRMLSACRPLRKHVPHTVPLRLSNLKMMAARYSSVYIKPDIGSYGIGIYKLTCLPRGYELFSTRKRKQNRQTFLSLAEVISHINMRQKGCRMIIQQAIKLGQLAGRPYDIRSMIQRKPRESWVCTGIMAKIGVRNRIVTNVYQGASLHTYSSLLKQRGLSEEARSSHIAYVTRKSLEISRFLSTRQKGMHELGIDFAMDRNNRLWILEVNSNHPQFHPLKNVDPPAYRRMMSFARSYGRRTAH
ncbi:YheC/YheD family protein [Paenibacillus nasutitermitis]|uniref:YheC/D like ATP-grasp n=1 Tax=Paenibacillus nasutitermitis TaxID=1652958 RepID=A0A916ZEG4_9BACL|nr:YheC/YheD family protein [Paenibacillus nasutitermitis]GGD90058.1 hypothetical protein GCM10010911_55860 [Paenibacillus nasutitermitis]